jgi:hypothetical protein
VVHWVYDTYEIGNATGRTVNQLGKTGSCFRSITFLVGCWKNP